MTKVSKCAYCNRMMMHEEREELDVIEKKPRIAFYIAKLKGTTRCFLDKKIIPDDYNILEDKSILATIPPSRINHGKVFLCSSCKELGDGRRQYVMENEIKKYKKAEKENRIYEHG